MYLGLINFNMSSIVLGNVLLCPRLSNWTDHLKYVNVCRNCRVSTWPLSGEPNGHRCTEHEPEIKQTTPEYIWDSVLFGIYSQLVPFNPLVTYIHTISYIPKILDSDGDPDHPSIKVIFCLHMPFIFRYIYLLKFIYKFHKYCCQQTDNPMLKTT